MGEGNVTVVGGRSEGGMERNVQRLLNRVSLILASVATLSLLHLFYRSSLSCVPSALLPRPRDHPLTLALVPFPRSSCDAAARPHLPPDRSLARLLSSRSWAQRVSSFSSAFALLRSLGALRNASRVLCAPAAPGQAAAALHSSGVSDVTAVDIVDLPPLVRRADPHNLPFFDAVFDLAFCPPGGLATALFPARFAAEIERTVRRGGHMALAVERCVSRAELDGIGALFKRSSLVAMRNITLVGSETTMIIMRRD